MARIHKPYAPVSVIIGMLDFTTRNVFQQNFLFFNKSDFELPVNGQVLVNGQTISTPVHMASVFVLIPSYDCTVLETVLGPCFLDGYSCVHLEPACS